MICNDQIEGKKQNICVLLTDFGVLQMIVQQKLKQYKMSLKGFFITNIIMGMSKKANFLINIVKSNQKEAHHFMALLFSCQF